MRPIVVFLTILVIISSCKKEDIPTVKTGDVASVTRTGASVEGEIISMGDSEVTEQGICWSTSEKPLITDNIKVDDSESNSFTIDLTDLEPGTEYFVRAYATNTYGTGYGEVVSFETEPPELPELYTYTYFPVSQNSVTFYGYLSSDGGSGIIEYGFYWGPSENPAQSDNYVIAESITSGVFSATITDMDPDMKYFVRSFARNLVGTGYGNSEWFSTCSGDAEVSIIGSWLNVRDPDCGPYIPGQQTEIKMEITSDSVFYEYHNNELMFSSPFTVEAGSGSHGYSYIHFTSPEAPYSSFQFKLLDRNNINFIKPIDYAVDPCDYYKRIE